MIQISHLRRGRARNALGTLALLGRLRRRLARFSSPDRLARLEDALDSAATALVRAYVGTVPFR